MPVSWYRIIKHKAIDIDVAVGEWQNRAVRKTKPLLAGGGAAVAAARTVVAPSDPTARALTWATLSASLSSGLFYSVSALFFTRSVGLTVTTVGMGLTVAGAVGVAGSYLAGLLADRFGAWRVLLSSSLGQGLALLAYVVAGTVPSFVLTACCAVGLRAMASTARQAVVARTFTGPDQVLVRARLRAVGNVSIGAGTLLAACALVIGTATAYRSTMVVAALLVLASCAPLLPLTRRPGTAAAICPSSDRERAGIGRSPLRDRTYLTVTALNAVMAMLHGLQQVGVPLWVVTHTRAPSVTVSALLALNTAMVALLQVWAARGASTVPAAGRAVVRAGALLASACALYAAAGHGDALVASVLLVLGAGAHSLAEMWAEAGSWALAFELADHRNAGAYQGVSQAGSSLGLMLAPSVVTATAIDHGACGWAALGAAFLAAGTGTGVIASRTNRPQRALHATEHQAATAV